MVQAFSSRLLLWSFFFSIIRRFLFIELLFFFRFLIKMGAAPFHMWMINIIKGLRWFSILIFSSFQKIIPIYGVYCFIFQSYKIIFILFCLIISAHGIFTACLFKVLIGYSSLFSLAWILSRETIIVIYFYLLLYFLNLFILCSILEFSSRDSLVELQKEKFFFKKLVVILRLLRIAGVPPLVGFLGKIYIIWELLLRLNLVLLFGLVIFSLIVLFLYLRFVTFILTFSHVYSIFSSDFFFKTEFIVFSLLLLPLVILLLGVWHKKNLIF